MKNKTFKLSSLAVAVFVLAGCGGSGSPDTTALPPTTNPGTTQLQAALAPALETCPVSAAAAVAPSTATELIAQRSNGWDSTQGQLSATANGTRVGVESNLASGVNCVSWRDANGNSRAMNLGAYLFDYVMNWGATRHVAVEDAPGHPGFGYVVSHNTQNSNSPLGSFMRPTGVKTTVFAGGNHAIHQVMLNYTRDTEAGGQGISIPVVIEWLVVAGKSDPLWTVNWKMNQAQNPNNINFNTYRMDSRGPYGSIGWDGKSRATSQSIAQVQWGIGGYKFLADGGNGAALTAASSWAMNQFSPTAYASARPVGSTLEFGLVQSNSRDLASGYQGFVSGRMDGKTSSTYNNGQATCASTNATMPCSTDWSYQMMAYSANDGSFSYGSTNGKLMTWGTPYGYLGATNLDLYDYSATIDATGERNYGTYVVWGEFGAVNSANDPIEAAKNSVDTATYWTSLGVNNGIGSIATTAKLPGSNTTRALGRYGYNETYGTFEVNVNAAGKADVTLRNGGIANTQQVLRRPVFVFNNYDGAIPILKINNFNAAAGSGYLTSYDTVNRRLWVTLLIDVPAQNTVHLELN